MKMENLNKSLSLRTFLSLTILTSVILVNPSHLSSGSSISSRNSSHSDSVLHNRSWSYPRIKRQLFREEIPHHRPLSGNIYATHHGFPHPGRWHPRPQSIVPPNQNSGHHFESPNVIITDEDFNRYGSTLQHIDNQLNQHPAPEPTPISHIQTLQPLHQRPQSQSQPQPHPPPLPQTAISHQTLGHSIGGRGHRKRRPIKILIHHHVHPTIHTKPIVHRYPIEYGKLIPLGESAVAGVGQEGPDIDGPVLPIIAAHHHQNLQNLDQENPGLSYVQEYKNIVQEIEQKNTPVPVLPAFKVKNLYQRFKVPLEFGKFFNQNQNAVPVLKNTWPPPYGGQSHSQSHSHVEQGKNGAFSWSFAY